MDWIGVALALVGIGIALLPLADQFNFLKPYAVPGGVALILAGLLLCLVPIWKRIQARREAKPRACAAPAPIRSPMTFKPEPPQPSPYVHRVVPMFLFRRIVRPDGNAQKSMTAPENKRRPNVAKGATHPSSWVTRSIASSERKADRGRSTPRGRLLGERHPEPRARVRPVRLKLSSRQADDPLLRLQFAIIIAPGNLRSCRG